MGFEHLRVYQAAEMLDREILRLIPLIKPGHSGDVNQLRRASGSGTYNIAEASGSEHVGRKLYLLEVAKGSVDETRSVLQRLVRAGALRKEDIYRACALSRTTAKMLTGWIHSIQDRAN
jgi:four helix bundle protein